MKTLEEIQNPEEATHNDPIADIVLASFRNAKTWRSTQTLGSKSIDAVLRDCYDQYHNVITPRDRQLMDEAGIDMKVSITKHKVDILIAWFRDLMQSSSESPFVISPTPIPDLSEDALSEVKAQILDAYRDPQAAASAGLPPPPLPGAPRAEVVEYAKAMKRARRDKERKEADKRAANMQKLIDDQLAEGDFRDTLLDFMTNFALYPYAVMYGPVVEKRPFLTWDKNTAKDTFKKVLVCRNISPFDYFWSPDTKAGGKGTFDIIRERVTRQYLLQCMSLPGFIKDNVRQAVEEYSDLATDAWLQSQNPEDKDVAAPGLTTDNDTVTILRYFGSLPGRVLKKFGIEGVDDFDYVEVEAIVLGRWTLRVVVSRQPKAVGRPIYVASYNKPPGSLAGYGIAQTIRDWERAFMASLRAGLANAAYSAAPSGEADYTRVNRYLTDPEALKRPVPGTVFMTDPDLTGSNSRALNFYNIPNHSGAMINLASYFIDMIDRISGLPAALSGQPVGTGVNRTFRGVAQLYANALKGVQSALTNLDKNVFQPLGVAYFVYNMRYSDDDSIKGDCHVMARGMSGLLQKEMNKQDKIDLLQSIAPLASSDKIPPGVIEFAIKQAVVAMGVPEDVYEQAEQEWRQSLAAQAAGPQMGGVETAAPTMPPGPPAAPEVPAMPVGG